VTLKPAMAATNGCRTVHEANLLRSRLKSETEMISSPCAARPILERGRTC
jgi:hypothetical protein